MEQRQLAQPAQMGYQGFTGSSQTPYTQHPSQTAYPSQHQTRTSAQNSTSQTTLDNISIHSTHSTHSQTFRLSPLRLPNILPQNNSTTSLLEAVIGRPPTPPPNPTPPVAPKALITQPRTQSINSHASASGSSEDHATSFGTTTEGEWDVLSDASLRLNKGAEEEIVEELQKKVNKRRSNLPHLESQLAALEAKIKAAEEKLARAQTGNTKAVEHGRTSRQ